eukprot:789136-Amphidinium_carterae.2
MPSHNQSYLSFPMGFLLSKAQICMSHDVCTYTQTCIVSVYICGVAAGMQYSMRPQDFQVTVPGERLPCCKNDASA